MNSILRKVIIITLILSATSCSVLKKSGSSNKKKEKPAVSNATSAKASIEGFFKGVPTVSKKGFFTLHVSANKYYFEIPDSLFGKDLLAVGRISKGASGIREGMLGYSGDHISTNMIRFEKGNNNKIFIRQILTVEMSKDSTQDMFQSVMRSNLHPIIGSFDIKSYSADSTSALIDVTDFFNADNEFFFFPKKVKQQLKLQAQQNDKSFMNHIHMYPENVEINVTKTYTMENRVATFELNSSIIQLPEKPMTSRYYDPRVGYFATGYIDYDQNPQGVEYINMITRWRLEPKPEDMEKYKAGELVEPQKPIIFYIDPSTPEKWVPYLIQGVNDWEPVFREAGFKNAIMAKRAPTYEEDSTWSIEDARYSAIVYKPSSIPNASGPHIRDPRSGEILESHVNWFHNVMSLLHDWYFVQSGAIDTAAQKMIFDDELMGQLIRFVSSHEIGHTLGMRHNFAATASYPVEKLRDREFLKENGHTSSIMDYSRFNFVAQPEDGIERELLFPRIGRYDKWCIEWGYRLFPEIDDPKKELPQLDKWIIEKTKDKRYWFGRENNPNDPRCQSEDLGDNPMQANTYAIKNLQRITDNLITWTYEPNEGYDGLRRMYEQIVGQYTRYMNHCVKWIGGIYENPKSREEEGVVYSYVEKAKQKEAFQFLNTQLFSTPEWLLNPDVFALIYTNAPTVMNSIYISVMTNIIHPAKMKNMLEAEHVLGANAYTLHDYFLDLNGAIFKELSSGGAVSLYRRNLQKVYTDMLLTCVIQFNTPAYSAVTNLRIAKNADHSDVSSMVVYQLKTLQKRLQNATSSDTYTKAHYLYLSEYIKNALEK